MVRANVVLTAFQVASRLIIYWGIILSVEDVSNAILKWKTCMYTSDGQKYSHRLLEDSSSSPWYSGHIAIRDDRQMFMFCLLIKIQIKIQLRSIGWNRDMLHLYKITIVFYNRRFKIA